ncbi:MAG: right-handed parallel beta-helix repeat-containing protein [Candidatus Micrarchaeota archaeon]
MMKNIARLLLYLVASATLVAAATTEQMPKGITVATGQTLDLTGRTIQTPTVVVNSGGTLLLSGTTLIMDGASNGTANIWVKGGTMNILASSEIKSANENRYTFWVDAGSNFEMRDSKISECGYISSENNKMGLLVKANGVIIENNYFGSNRVCVLLSQADSAKIIGNQFNNCEKQAVFVEYSSSVEISSNEFSTNDPAQYSISLSSCLNNVVSDNVFNNPNGLGLVKTNSSTISGNDFRDPTEYSITLSTEYWDSKEDILENNTIAGKLFIRGTSNTVKGGSVGTELRIDPEANSNKFDGVKFENSDMVLNSQTTSGTAFDNNVFDGTQFTEDNAVLRLGNNNSVKNTAFGKNITISVEGAGNTIEGVTITDAAGITISGGNVAAGSGSNVIRESSIALQPEKSITCDGFCRIENNVISEASTGISGSSASRASFEALCPYTCASGQPTFPLCTGTWQQETFPCLQSGQACWRCAQTGTGAPGQGGQASTPPAASTPVPPEQQYAKVVLNNGGVVSGNSIKPAEGFAVSVKGSGAYLYNNDLGVVLFDGGSGVSEKNTLGSVEGRNGADYVLLNTILGGCSGDCGQNANIINDATSTAERQWWVAVRVTDENDNPLDGTFKMTSKTTGKKYSGTVRNGLLTAPFNATEWVFGSTAGAGMSGSVLSFADSGDYNPYGWEACSGDNCETGDDSFTKETMLPVIIKGMMAATETPSTPPQGQGAPTIPLPQGVYFKVARHTGLQLGNTYEATVSLLINGTGLCDPAMTLTATRDGADAGAGRYKGCQEGMHLFEIDTKAPGTYTLVAHSVINGKSYDSWSENVVKFGQPPKATPEMTPLLALGAALFAFWALRRKR